MTERQIDQARPREQERGQIILLLAFALVGLLVAAGLATDAGVLFARKTQLDRAVEAAALSGVVRLAETSDLDEAHVRGMQLMATNRVITTSPDDCNPSDANFWLTHDYCGSQSPGTVPGSVRYHVEARWDIPTFFMTLVGFDTVRLYSRATAEYMPMVDIFASDTSQFGLLKTANQSIWGPQICIDRGDAYAPVRGVGNSSTQPYYDEIGGVYTYRVSIPADYPYSRVRIEIFDADGGNNPNNTHTVYRRDGSGGFSYTCGARATNCLVETGDSEDGNPWWYLRVDETQGSGTNCSGHVTNQLANNNLLFRVFYFAQMTDGSLQEVDLAYYIGKIWAGASDPNPATHPTTFGSYTASWTADQAYTEATLTDMMWISPGAPAGERMPAYTSVEGITGLDSPEEPATFVENCEAFRSIHFRTWEAGGLDARLGFFTSAPACSPTTNGDFIIDLGAEVPGIYRPSGGGYELFIQVSALRGSGENDYEIWAGPALSEDPSVQVPAQVNARQVYIINQAEAGVDVHLTEGVGIYAVGRMPMNMIADNRTEIPLAYLGPEFSGQNMTVQIFDADSGTQTPIVFYFDTIPRTDWEACFGSSAECGGSAEGPGQIPRSSDWATYEFTIPSEGTTPPIPFYGGRLIVSYDGGNTDNFTWKITLESRPFLVE